MNWKAMSSERIAVQCRIQIERSNLNPWKPLSILHERGGRHEFEIGKKYLESGVRLNRICGAQILSQLQRRRSERRSLPAETVALLLPAIDEAADDEELEVLLRALSWQGIPAGFRKLMIYSRHPNPAIRHVVAWGLPGENRDEAEVLAELSQDTEIDVCDWALFNLSSWTTDYPELHETLWKLTQSKLPVMRGQALLSLARRHVAGTESALIAELSRSDGEMEFNYISEAVELLASPAFLPILQSLTDRNFPKGTFAHQYIRRMLHCCLKPGKISKRT